jgi:TolA-binding protein
VIFCCLNTGLADIRATGGFSAPYFQADYVQDLSEFSAALINPALLFRVNQIHVELGIYRWGGFSLFDDLGYQQMSVLLPVRLHHTFGLTVISSGSEYMKYKLEGQDLKEDGRGDYWETWFIGHYSYKFSALPWLSIGCNPKVVLQKQFDRRKAGFGFDFGTYANIFDHYRYGDLGVSLNFQDVIPANIVWTGKNTQGDYTDSLEVRQLMTTRGRLGLRYAVMNDRLIFDAELVADNLLQALWKGVVEKGLNEGQTLDSIGEYMNREFRVSAHAKFQWIPQLWLKAGWANNNIPYFGFNSNIIFLWPEMINNVALDVHFGYSLNDFNTDEGRGPTGMVKVAADIGPTREQRESKRLYEKLILAPMDIYNKAMRLYTAKRFWDASFVFGKLLSLYPNFHLCDKATYYMGDCYTQLRLNAIARQIFKEALAEYTTSQVRANYLYGLQYLDYREGRYKDALKNHAFIVNLYGDDDIRPDADYIAGEIHCVQKNYSAATQILEGIPSDAAVYNYAQYTLSIINIENNKITAAIQNLTNVISDTSMAKGAELQLLYAAEVKLGQLYFEQVELRKAVEACKRVPEASEHGDEALLVIAWSWIKANRPQECLHHVDQLISYHPESPLLPEAYLVKGYSQMLLRQNPPALESFNQCVELSKTEFANQEDMKFKRQKFQQYYTGFLPTENQIKKNALRKPTDKIIAERAGLKTEYDKYAKESRDYFVYKILVEDNKKFFRRKEQLLMDAEYAIAKVSKMIGTKEQKKIIEKTVEEEEKIDTEIEELKKQLEELEDQ